VPECQKLKM